MTDPKLTPPHSQPEMLLQVVFGVVHSAFFLKGIELHLP